MSGPAREWLYKTATLARGPTTTNPKLWVAGNANPATGLLGLCDHRFWDGWASGRVGA